jgi:hypothetical protein
VSRLLPRPSSSSSFFPPFIRSIRLQWCSLYNYTECSY